MIAPAHHEATLELHRRAAAAIRPRPRVLGVDWIPQHVVIPQKLGATPGRYSFDRYPYVRGVIEAADDPTTETIALQWGTQLGKTTALIAMACHWAVNSPAPAMLAGPDQAETLRVRDLFYAVGVASPRVRERLLPRQDWNARVIDVQQSVIWLAWAGSEQRLSGKSCRRVLCTEVDRWPVSPREGEGASLIEERVKAFFRSLIIYEGSPTDENSTICSFYDESDRRTFRVSCPECGHYQELRFFPHKGGRYQGAGGLAGLQDSEGRWRSPDEVLTSVYYLCEQGCRIDARWQRSMIARGVWCPEGQTVTAAGALAGQPKRGPRDKGFRLSSLYSMTRSWGRAARKYLRVRSHPHKLKVFWNAWLALKWEERTKAPRWRELGRRLAGVHRRGTAPGGALFLTAGADVQKRDVYFVVRAWGEGGTSWLVDYGQLPIDVEEQSGRLLKGSHLAKLAPAIVDNSWALAQRNSLGRHSLQCRLLGVDSQWEPHDVWDFCRAQPGGRVKAVAGSAMIEEFWRERLVKADAKTGRRKYAGGGMQRVELNSAFYRRDVQDRWQMSPEQPGAWFLFAEPIKEAEPYLRQVVNEVEVVEDSPKKGRPKRVWRIVDERTGNHYWDCEVIARAMADMVTGGRWKNLAARFAGQQQRRRAAPSADPEEHSAR